MGSAYTLGPVRTLARAASLESGPAGFGAAAAMKHTSGSSYYYFRCRFHAIEKLLQKAFERVGGKS